jgi:RimJ/RimL family protein N-acetyltransferase
MAAELLYSPLLEGDIEELAAVLHNEAVYQFIGGVPSRTEFDLWLRRSIAGPPTESTGEQWINVAVRLAETGQIIGRLEANLHDELAEVAFLYSPKLWGCGYASKGLHWLHDQLRQHPSVRSLWATTHPENQRSAALLVKCGYAAASSQELPVLYSYERGDLVFQRGVA